MDSQLFSLDHELAVHVADDGWLSWQTSEEWQMYAYKLVCTTLNSIGWTRLSEVSLMLTNDKHMQELNYTYRQKNKPTNVLSFPAFQREELASVSRLQEPVILGDIVLSLETVLKESQEQGKLFLNHFAHLLVHGTLHLMGYDHENDKDAEEMENLEIRILNNLGMANPYQ